MIRKMVLWGCAALLTALTAGLFIAAEAEARAGGGRSSGSRGSRSYSRPASPSPYQGAQQQARPANPSATGQSQPAGGSFLRSMAGGLMGGMLGGMLFRSLGFGGAGGTGGGGIGMFEILLLAGIGYLIYRFVKSRRQMAEQASGNSYYAPQTGTYDMPTQSAQISSQGDRDRGLSHIRQMDAGFDESKFTDQVMDIFFKIQSAWMNRELAPVNALLADEMRRTFQSDIDRLLSEKKINRLENIAVRTVEIAEAWQEQGQDYITALIYANLLDYTTDDTTGQVVSGSKTEPVKFEEFWTFTRPVGRDSSWKLCGIDQK